MRCCDIPQCSNCPFNSVNCNFITKYDMSFYELLDKLLLKFPILKSIENQLREDLDKEL